MMIKIKDMFGEVIYEDKKAKSIKETLETLNQKWQCSFRWYLIFKEGMNDELY